MPKKLNARKAKVAKTSDPTLQPQLPTPDAAISTKKVDELSVGVEVEEGKSENGGVTISRAESVRTDREHNGDREVWAEERSEPAEMGAEGCSEVTELVRKQREFSAERTELLAQLAEAKKEKEELGRRMREKEQELDGKRLKLEAELTNMVEGLQAQLTAVVKYPSRERMTDPDGYILTLDEEADYWKEKYWSLGDRFAELCARNEKKGEKKGEKNERGKGRETKDIPPVTKKPVAKRQAAKPAARPPQAAKPQLRTIKSGVTAIVVHGVPCRRPIADIIQDAKYTGLDGVLRARWLLGARRREGKSTSSVVIYTSFEFVKLGERIKFRGRWLPVDPYEPDRGKEQ